MAEYWPIQADRCLLNVALEIVRESSVRECTSENFVFSKQDKENSSTDAGDEHGFGKRGVRAFCQCFLLTRYSGGASLVQLTSERVNPRLQDIADGKHAQ